ncbi:hypothetical protein AVV36_gp220 [Pectobacterium bacteriophage PM2]|uniref:Uncharacterized protein n=1 Tax=Pectobacterium bacteriophage PM2 TaxID=1429794 RepID=A0A0A0Q2H2_9CAUD|nr:hypothetical protein AVV36_gp220 [Pectobacterium bacteriophage PM2]AHY25190.1 hypothetical protein PM2_228 [Pectobacterium bacteriophage PM2]
MQINKAYKFKDVDSQLEFARESNTNTGIAIFLSTNSFFVRDMSAAGVTGISMTEDGEIIRGGKVSFREADDGVAFIAKSEYYYFEEIDTAEENDYGCFIASANEDPSSGFFLRSKGHKKSVEEFAKKWLTDENNKNDDVIIARLESRVKISFEPTFIFGKI